MPIPVDLIARIERDRTAKRREHPFGIPSILRKQLCFCLRDLRDVPVAALLINILVSVVPSALLVAHLRSHWIGAAYVLINFVLFLQRFLVALLHVSEHRPLFNESYGILNLLVSNVLAPLYGVPCGMYKLHHKVMHHVEGNTLPGDSSSTLCYQRDSLADFLRYWAKHVLGAWVMVPLYALRKKRWRLFWECLLCEGGYLLALGCMVQYNLVAALWVLIVPFVLTSVALMFGNWSQHIFVDISEPQNVFRSTYNCVDCPDNQKTFNDGYHILHHLNSQTHWSELPVGLIQHWERHAKEEALTFVGVGFFDVGLQVMLGRLDRLADCCITGRPRSKIELIELMQSRLKPL